MTMKKYTKINASEAVKEYLEKRDWRIKRKFKPEAIRMLG